MYGYSRWQKYKYAVAALIAIMVFCGFTFSYLGVVIAESAPATKALDNITVTTYVPQQESVNQALFIFSTGSAEIARQGYLNITNTGSQNLTLDLTLSATVTAYNQQQTNYNLGSISVTNVAVNAHSSRIISPTLDDKTPIVHWTERPSGYWGYSWYVQASVATNYLFLQTAVGSKTFDFNGSAIIL